MLPCQMRQEGCYNLYQDLTDPAQQLPEADIGELQPHVGII